jgi:Tfp pilus assembly PilM family ATPase
LLEDSASRSLLASDLNEDDWVAAVGAALWDLQRTMRLRGQCVIGLPGHLAFNRLVRLPRVAGRQRRRIIEFEKHQGMSAAAEAMIWSEAAAVEVEDGQELILAAAKRCVIEGLLDQLRALGLRPAAMLPAWLVLQHAIEDHPLAAGDALVLSVGARSSQLVFRRQERLLARAISFGGNSVTMKLAEELAVDFPSAELLKLRGDGGCGESAATPDERKAYQAALDQFVRRLCAEIQSSLSRARPGGDHGRTADLYLTGGGARLARLPEALGERLQIRVARWDSWAGTATGRPATNPDDILSVDRRPDLTGLAAYAVKGLPAAGNLLSRSFRRELFLRRRWRWLVAAAMIAILAGLLPAWQFRGRARAMRLQIAETDAQIADLRRIDAGNRASLARLAEARRRIAALQKLRTAQTGWVAFLGDLQARLAQVEDAWIDRLEVSPAGGNGTEEGIRIQVAGCLFEGDRLSAGAAGEPDPKTAALLAALRGSPFVGAVEREHFDDGPAGLRCFEMTLRLAPHALN